MVFDGPRAGDLNGENDCNDVVDCLVLRSGRSAGGSEVDGGMAKGCTTLPATSDTRLVSLRLDLGNLGEEGGEADETPLLARAWCG